MYARIEAACFLENSSLQARIRKFCAIQGWDISIAPTGVDVQFDLIFVDSLEQNSLLLRQYPHAVLVSFTKTQSENPSTGLLLSFSPTVRDHQLLDGITTALNLARFRRQFYENNSEEPITKLPHHPEWLAAMEAHVGHPTSFLIIQIDHAEHLYTDLDPVSKTDLLGALSEHLQAVLPPDAAVGIFDAGCFAVGVPKINRLSLDELAEDVVQAGHMPIFFRSGELHFTLSVGYAAEKSLQHPKLLWQRAWEAKEQARNEGGNRCQPAGDPTSPHADLAARIPSALSEDEFSLVLQPLFDITGETLQGVETLLRWQGLEVGNLFPEHFIPVAERSGQMARVGDWVMEKVCHTSSSWFEHTIVPITIGVNTSPAQFRNGAIQQQISRLTKERWLNPASLELEMTHADLLHVVDKHRTTLFKLRDAGVKFAIDNLGTDIIDTQKLLRCPADTLKIDRTLVAQLESEENARTLVAHICELGQKFNLRVVAVGVESERQRSLLAEMGCTHVQGYLFVAPIPLQDFRDFIVTHRQGRHAQTG